jgi:hypothetical protein
MHVTWMLVLPGHGFRQATSVAHYLRPRVLSKPATTRCSSVRSAAFAATSRPAARSRSHGRRQLAASADGVQSGRVGVHDDGVVHAGDVDSLAGLPAQRGEQRVLMDSAGAIQARRAQQEALGLYCGKSDGGQLRQRLGVSAEPVVAAGRGSPPPATAPVSLLRGGLAAAEHHRRSYSLSCPSPAGAQPHSTRLCTVRLTDRGNETPWLGVARYVGGWCTDCERVM